MPSAFGAGATGTGSGSATVLFGFEAFFAAGFLPTSTPGQPTGTIIFLFRFFGAGMESNPIFLPIA